mmetsp:Transcript_66624/g.215373  ORF Transcript_66624/g.215373 Transcript_66624/m.215373 type:complete len:207 (-) Transcript_66624:684-1304(-)
MRRKVACSTVRLTRRSLPRHPCCCLWSARPLLAAAPVAVRLVFEGRVQWPRVAPVLWTATGPEHRGTRTIVAIGSSSSHAAVSSTWKAASQSCSSIERILPIRHRSVCVSVRACRLVYLCACVWYACVWYACVWCLCPRWSALLTRFRGHFPSRKTDTASLVIVYQLCRAISVDFVFLRELPTRRSHMLFAEKLFGGSQAVADFRL